MNEDPLGDKIEALQKLVENRGDLGEISDSFYELLPMLEEEVAQVENRQKMMDKRIAFGFTLPQLESLNHLFRSSLREERDYENLALEGELLESLRYLVQRLPEIEDELRCRLASEAE